MKRVCQLPNGGIVIFLSLSWIATHLSGCSQRKEESKPNIIVFYVDDLGYGDIGCYGAKSLSTPNIDSLAINGVRFTDGHSSSATCTPSRFSLLTGLYAFRSRAAILPGDAPLLIDTAKITLPKILKKAGYSTAVIGKWHLGLGYGKINWNKHVRPGANEIGFDYSFLIPATGDRVPTVFLEDGLVVGADSEDPIYVDYSRRLGNDSIGAGHPSTLKVKADMQHSNTVVNGVSRIGFMSGGKRARWTDEDFPGIFNEKAFAFVKRSPPNKPFFLFYSFHDIHVPRLPNERFSGKSTMGPRGDVIAQVDWVVGEMIAFLRASGELDNTLIIFTSDNGAVLDDGYFDQAKQLVGLHQPNGQYKGGKYSAYEAGTRVPTIVFWKGHVSPKISDAVLSQVDLMASIASLVQVDIDTENIDSKNQLQAWLGRDDRGREVLLEESFTLSIRKGNWKYIRPLTSETPDWLAHKDIEVGLSSNNQLFNLTEDPSEEQNVANKFPEKVKELDDMIERLVQKKDRGR